MLYRMTYMLSCYVILMATWGAGQEGDLWLLTAKADVEFIIELYIDQ